MNTTHKPFPSDFSHAERVTMQTSSLAAGVVHIESCINGRFSDTWVRTATAEVISATESLS